MGTTSTGDLNQFHGWQVIAEHGWRFARDEIEIRIAARTHDNQRLIAEPIKIELAPYVDNAGPILMEPTVFPRELAEALYNAIGHTLTGIDKPYDEIVRLRRELNKEHARVDALISGIGSLGDTNAKSG